MDKSSARLLPFVALGVMLLFALRLGAQTVAAKKVPVAVLEGRPDLSIVPDTPANRRLIDAAMKSDLAGVRAAFAQGASADTKLEMSGRESVKTPVAILATQVDPEKKTQVRLVFREIVARLKKADAVDTLFNRSILMSAVELEDLPSVRLLVEHGANLETRMKMRGMPMASGRTALFDAILIGGGIRKDASPVLTYLLDKGANPNVVTDDGQTPLIEASLYGKDDVVKALLAHGAAAAGRDASGRSALDYAARRGDIRVGALLDAKAPMDLRQAAAFGNVARLRAALDAGADPNASGARGRPALMSAVVSGKLDAVRLLLDRKAKLDATDREGRSALHLAAQAGDPKIIALLLSRGADPNAVAGPHGLRDGEPATPLLEAVDQARPDAVELLLRHVDPRAHGQLDAALRLAVATAGGMPNLPSGFPRKRRDETGLLQADDRILNALLKAGASPRAEGSRAVALAAENGQAELVDLLLDRGGEPNGRLRGDDVVHRGATALIASIDAMGMSASEEERIAGGTEFTSTPVGEIRRAIDHARKTFELLLRRGADPNLVDGSGETPLMHAVDMEVPILLGTLVKRGARIEARRPDGRTALMLAAADDHLSIVQRLVALGARAEVADASGRTALMVAIDNGENDEARKMRDLESYPGPMTRDDLPNKDGHPSLVRYLLAHGANPNARAKDGTTALSLARKEGFRGVISILTGR